MAFVNVEGEVSRLHGSGGGFGLKESWTAQGKERSRFWAVFPKDAVSVSVGDKVKVSGGLQTSVTDPKPDSQGVERVYVDHVVGQAKVEVTQASHHGPGGGFGGGSAQGQGEWAQPPVNGAQAGAQGFGGGFESEPF